jgi:glycine dehydrogenase subunit 2
MKAVRSDAYHAAKWSEPIIHELGKKGRRGFFAPSDGSEDLDVSKIVPEKIARKGKPELPELSEPEVLMHYEHLSQQVLGMMGISLFGTCTMKYNPRIGELVGLQEEVADVHPLQDPSTIQGILEILYKVNEFLCDLSGMDRFIFQPGGGAHASYTHACITRAYFKDKGELGKRNEIITTMQSHPCNAATAAAAGFRVVTLPIEENGYPSLEALKAAVSERTAALMVGNPDDMGIYNPEIKMWTEIVHSVGGLCFYDHANFNGVMGKIRAAELGFDACMFMLHKTFGAPKGGGGPAVGAYGCKEHLIKYLPGPLIVRNGDRYDLIENSSPPAVGRIREYLGNVPQVIKAYIWLRSMGIDGVQQASDISVLVNNYMDKRLTSIPGVKRALPHLTGPRMEMTRYSVEEIKQQTGVSIIDIQHRMLDFGIDAFWLSHEPWFVPEPFTPEAGEMWSKEDIDYWIDCFAMVCEEARTNPDFVRTAPHNQVLPRGEAVDVDQPDKWATTWRAYQKKWKNK